MKTCTLNIPKIGFLGLIVLLILSSCVPQKKIRYFQDLSNADTTKSSFALKKSFQYKVQPGDNLYIRIHSFDEKTVAYFNAEAPNASSYMLNNDISVYLNSYSVNDSGYVDFPLIGKMYVKDQTIAEVKAKIQKVIDEYLKETTVVVKLVNYNVTLLGEVRKPGTYRVWQDDITIFQAISLAGDLTDFAKRNTVTLIRQSENGTKRYRLNLNDQKILESEFYYLLPNDLVYIEPLKGKQFTFENFPYAIIFAGITTFLLLYAYLKQ
jgi:polysaccharide export outer membrane protein